MFGVILVILEFNEMLITNPQVVTKGNSIELLIHQL